MDPTTTQMKAISCCRVISTVRLMSTMKSIFMTRFHIGQLPSTSKENGKVTHIHDMKAISTQISGVR